LFQQGAVGGHSRRKAAGDKPSYKIRYSAPYQRFSSGKTYIFYPEFVPRRFKDENDFLKSKNLPSRRKTVRSAACAAVTAVQIAAVGYGHADVVDYASEPVGKYGHNII
jgi:hypothetical protein